MVKLYSVFFSYMASGKRHQDEDTEKIHYWNSAQYWYFEKEREEEIIANVKSEWMNVKNNHNKDTTTFAAKI